ncbi:MAG: hypothetical protein E7598_03570 [Ruminococcaceae bacterium]|nr:hypothetical protein [Oscillospiraceae bacterium]
MKKRFLALLTVLLIAALMTTAVFASTSLVLDSSVNTSAELAENNTFDVYIVISPLNFVGTAANPSANSNWIYRVAEDSANAKTAPAVKNQNTKNEKFTLTWDNNSLMVDAVEYHTGASVTVDQVASATDGYKYAYLAKTLTSVVTPNVSGVGAGNANTGTLVIDFGSDAVAGFIVRSEASEPKTVVAKVTFRVIAGAEGGDETITLDNTYTYIPSNKSGSNAQTSVTVKVAAGCEHANMTALTPKELEAAGLTNAEATCMAAGHKWFYCADCGKNVEQLINAVPHDFSVEKYIDGKVETCTSGAEKAMFCSTEGCNEYDKDSVTPIEKLGHTFSEHAYLAPNCTDDGYDFNYCVRCGAVANGEQHVAGAYYIEGKLYANSTGTTLLDKAPDAVALAALGHEWQYDRTEGDIKYYVCTRKDVCGVEDKAISANDTVRYAANTEKGNGSGSSAENATTLDKAFKELGALPAGEEATIYLTETIDLPQLQVSSNNTIEKSYEEYPHEATITITTAPGVSKAALHFAFDSVSQYYLYGPTVFDNIYISSDAKGTTNGSSASTSFFARGFRFEATENLEMKSTLEGDAAIITYAKTGGNFGYSIDISYDFAACKVYLMGGFYSDGTNKGLYEGTNGTTFEANLVLNGGEFYVVSGGGRNNSGLPIHDSEINISVGGNVVIGQLAPVSIHASADVAGTVTNIHYYGGTIIVAYRGEMQPRSDGQYTVNHFFHNGCGKMKVGDFQLGKTDPAHVKNVNCYYSVSDNASPSAEDYGLAFIKKGDDYVVKSKEIHENLTFPEYCSIYRDGHTLEGGKCTFCDTVPCENHVSEVIVLSEADCTENGVYLERCSVCFEKLGEQVFPASKEYHEGQWYISSDKSQFEYKCTICHNVLITRANNTTEFYVSDNGKPDGGFTADYPVNDFEKVYDMATAAGAPATIYVVGTASVYPNYTGSSSNSVFVEPVHTNLITIKGYNNNGTLKLLNTNGGRTLYTLNGATTFENIEFSSWTSEMGSSTAQYTYIIAQHNHLTFGENVSIDFMRNTNQNKIVGSYVIVGGCYHYKYNKNSSVKAADCAGGNNHVTFYSGSFYEFIGGSTGGTCNEASITIDVLGDVSFRDYFSFGGFEQNAGNVVFTLDGSLSTGSYLSIVGVNKTADLSAGSVGDVTLKILSGSLALHNSESQSSSVSNPTNRPLGATLRPENGVYDITRNLDSLTIIYDPADASARETALRFKSLVVDGSKTIIYETLDSETVCSVAANGQHTPTLRDTHESTCAEQGYNLYYCSVCRKEYSVSLPKLDHTFGEPETFTPATCSQNEIEKKVCVCGYTVYVVGDGVKTDHTYDENDVCTGCNLHHQVLCDHKDEQGNDLWTLVDSEYKTGCGVGTKEVCSECLKERIEVLSADHNFGKYTVTVQPTATEPGVKVRSCRSCGKTETAVIYADGGAINSSAIATDANGNLADIDVATSKLTTAEKEVLNALLQDTSYGSEVKVSYKVDGDNITDITYSIPLPAEYSDLKNVKVVVKDDNGTLHTVEFTVEKGYIVFKF